MEFLNGIRDDDSFAGEMHLLKFFLAKMLRFYGFSFGIDVSDDILKCCNDKF